MRDIIATVRLVVGKGKYSIRREGPLHCDAQVFEPTQVSSIFAEADDEMNVLRCDIL